MGNDLLEGIIDLNKIKIPSIAGTGKLSNASLKMNEGRGKFT